MVTIVVVVTMSNAGKNYGSGNRNTDKKNHSHHVCDYLLADVEVFLGYPSNPNKIVVFPQHDSKRRDGVRLFHHRSVPVSADDGNSE